MCGIYLTNIPYSEDVVKKKLNSIAFRGPDAMGIQKVNTVTLGHLRLSILDLDVRSNQPMSYNELYIVYNGEIYNYKDIRSELISLGYTFHTESDTEVLLLGYKAWGKEILQKINGMFAFSIYNAKSNTIFSARDRLGVKPFYYYYEKGNFEICSQIKPIFDGKTLNEDAISMYLDCKFIPGPYTIANGVYKLPPGNYMELDLTKNIKTIKEFWNLKKVSITKRSYDEVKKELHILLKDSVRIRLQSDVPIGSFLSGGIDSALVSSLAQEVSSSKIKTFCVGFDDPAYDESKVANKYAEILRTDHTTIQCKPSDFLKLIPTISKVYDEPFGDTSALPSLLLNSVTKEHVTVALSGDGGDESFFGYTHFDSLHRNRFIISIPFFIRNILSKPVFLNLIGKNSLRVRSALKTKSTNEFIERIFSRKGLLLKLKKESWMKYYQGYKTWSSDLLQKAADLNIKLWLDNDSNVKVDRASMAFSVEVRSPFLDYRVIEFARTMPTSYRFNDKRKKKILRDILKEYIPEEVFDQPKQGFIAPIDHWIRNELKEEISKSISDEFLEKLPNFNIPVFKRMFREHMTGRENHKNEIWKVYILSQWFKEYINQSEYSKNQTISVKY